MDNQTENCPKCPGYALYFPKYNVKKGQWIVVDNQFETSYSGATKGATTNENNPWEIVI